MVRMAPGEDFAARMVALRQRAQQQRSEDWRQRRERLKGLRRAFVKRRKALQEALAVDLGRPSTETDLVEYLPTVSELDDAIANVGRWAKPIRPGTPFALFGAKSKIIPQPKGVCLIMAPWNYPANLVLGPLTSCLAAGNTAVVKPSEFAPATSAFLRELLSESFDPAEVQLVEGGAETAEALLEQDFNHIFFTGSPKIGRIVMTAAAKGPTSVTLELGGKSPTYIHKSADLKSAVPKIVWGKFVNAGQTCIAPDYLLIDQEIAEEAKIAIAAQIRKIFPKESEQGERGDDYSAIINERHASRLVELLDDARDKGAEVVVGGHANPAARFVAPTLLDRITSQMRIDSEEIFGPILPVRTVSGLDAAIAHVNAGPPPLASYVFANDQKVADRYIGEVPAGGSCINHTILHFANERLPFGGIGPSGIGRSHGAAGFAAFSEMHAVLRDRFSMTHRFFPPYTASVRRQLTAFLKLRGAA